jgi:hypothetical protein
MSNGRMTTPPRWTCARCGRRERSWGNGGKPTPRGWAANGAIVLCGDCKPRPAISAANAAQDAASDAPNGSVARGRQAGRSA